MSLFSLFSFLFLFLHTLSQAWCSFHPDPPLTRPRAPPHPLPDVPLPLNQVPFLPSSSFTKPPPSRRNTNPPLSLPLSRFPLYPSSYTSPPLPPSTLTPTRLLPFYSSAPPPTLLPLSPSPLPLPPNLKAPQAQIYFNLLAFRLR